MKPPIDEEEVFGEQIGPWPWITEALVLGIMYALIVFGLFLFLKQNGL